MSEKKKISDLLQAQSDESGWIEKNIVSNAPLLVALFANFVVIISDVRAYDVIYNLTGSVWKALAASFACAIPFIMWEVSWQYNHTTEPWRKASLVMAGIAFATSLALGVADFIPTADTDGTVAAWLLGGVVVARGLHTVMGILYNYNDPDVARKRNKAQALAKMLDQELNAQVAGNLLESGRNLLDVISSLEGQYDPEDVAAVLRILEGKKREAPSLNKKGGKNNQPRPQQPMQVYNSDTNTAKTQQERPQRTESAEQGKDTTANGNTPPK